ncbi:MAG: 4Fe-4S dicluster domain-containing protein [Tenuifilaceae bacterium]
MAELLDMISADIRYIDGLKACMNCGVCTAICPAAEFYNYDPRDVCNTLMSKDEVAIAELLKTDKIWHCGQCLSCKTRCPRGNVPGLLISLLREVSIRMGYFTESEEGRRQYAIKKTLGEHIVDSGYCVHVMHVKPHLHPEQGPGWEWYFKNSEVVADRQGGNYNKEGSGALRKISEESLKDLRKIFEVTGGKDFFEQIDRQSKKKASELKKNITDNVDDNEYFYHVYREKNETQE